MYIHLFWLHEFFVAGELDPVCRGRQLNRLKAMLLYGSRIDISGFGCIYQNLGDCLSFAIHARSGLAQHSERNGDLSPKVASPARISP